MVFPVPGLSRVEMNGQKTPALDRSTLLVKAETLPIPVKVISISGECLRYSVVKFGRVNYLEETGFPALLLPFPSFPVGLPALAEPSGLPVKAVSPSEAG